MITRLLSINRFMMVEPMDLNIWVGLFDDPADEVIEVMLIAADPNRAPEFAAVREMAVWTAMEAWRVVGTALDIGPIMTTVRDEESWRRGDVKWSNNNIPTSELEVMIVGITDVGSSVIIAGSITLRITIFQRKFPGPDKPPDLSWEEWVVDK